MVRRPGESDPQVFVVTRDTVKLAQVTSSLEKAGEKNIGYIRIKQFSTSTADDVKAALLAFTDAQAFVLDLRGNTGGYFTGGLDVARLFLPQEKPMTYTIDKRGTVTPYTNV